MYALIGIGSLMAIWTTVLIWFDRRMASRTQMEVINAIDARDGSHGEVEGISALEGGGEVFSKDSVRKG